METYLNSVKKEFARYKSLGDKTFAQVTDRGLFWRYNPESNSIATIVKHLAGNMLSRWTDFLTTDGEKPWRNRDTEFEDEISTRQQLMDRWEEGWACLFAALDTINEENWHNTIYIRNEPHSLTDAINRQLAHYPYHVGQIVFIGKMISEAEWTSLSVPKGKSEEFNAEKMQGNADSNGLRARLPS